jgi:integrase
MGIPKESALTLRANSVQSPPALIANLCSVLEVKDKVIVKGIYLASELSPWPLPLRVIIDMQLQLGLRISEVLRIRSFDILPLGKLRIRASKRGQDRIENYTDAYGFLKFCKRNGVQPFSDYNRFFIYRAYKKEGISLFHSKTKRMSVTHALRHKLVHELEKEVDQMSLISDILGHKSRRSIESYLKKKGG